MTPMHIAGIMFDLECFELLIKLIPDLSNKDKENNTALFYLEDNEDIDKNILAYIKNNYFK